MVAERRRVAPRTFYLNESHELASSEKEGGGRLSAYAPIHWAAKAQRLSETLQRVEQIIVASNDPLKDERFFVLANPVPEVEKLSTNKKKAPQGTYKEPTEFGGTHGRVFDRLGMDLLQVTDSGLAIVHAKKATMDQLRDRSASLETLGAREQSRWITIDSFETIPLQLRVDSDWLNHLSRNDPSEVIFELQPVLTRLEVERVLRAISALLLNDERLTGTGSDFSGRHGFEGLLLSGQFVESLEISFRFKRFTRLYTRSLPGGPNEWCRPSRPSRLCASNRSIRWLCHASLYSTWVYLPTTTA